MKKKKSIAFALTMALALTASAFAAESNVLPIGSTPGSIWDSYGTIPVENDNWVNQLHLDQGIVTAIIGNVWEVTPYAAINIMNNSKGYYWEDTSEIEGGVKLVRHFDSGVIDFGVAYGNEYIKNITPSSYSSLMFFTDGWFGYNSFGRDDTPSSIWWTVGNVTPFEGDNIIGLARVDQGYNFYQQNNIALGVAGWGEIGFDTRGYFYNNRQIIGIGLRASTSGKHGSAIVTVGFECFTGQSVAGQSISSNGCGPAINLDLWDGWNNMWRQQ